MVIAVLGKAVCGFPMELITGRILPGAAASILLGNFYYAWQARQLARRTGRDDITALPYGINTPSVIAFIFLIMGPVYRETGDAQLAWKVGLAACFLSGLMEVAGAFAGDWLRRNTPRAALLSALSGIAITFIAMGFVFQIFATPVLALLPMMLILINYASGLKLPLGIPGGLLAVLVGALFGWGLRGLGYPYFQPSTEPYVFGLHFFKPAVEELLSILNSPLAWSYLSIIFPMGLFNVIGSLQNLESAEAAGDRFETRPSLLVNGLGSLCAALLGSAFPTTIYIGHPGWKAMGARSGYSIINGLVITLLCCVGGVTLVLKVIPLEATLGILLWIGLIITAQAFQESPRRHALAVGIGFIPALASWALVLIETALLKAGTSLFETAPKFGADLFIDGVIALSQGFILTSMVLAAVLAFIIDRRFLYAAYWCFAASALSCLGIMHGYRLTPKGVENAFGWLVMPQFTVAYALAGVVLIGLHLWAPQANGAKRIEPCLRQASTN